MTNETVATASSPTLDLPLIRGFAEGGLNLVWLSFTILASFIPLAAVYLRYLIIGRVPQGTKPIPGPWGIPFIGRVHDVDPKKPWFKMKDFSDQFKGFYQTTIMGEKHLWIGDHQIALDLLGKRAGIYSSRPQVPAVPGSDVQGQYLPLLAHDDHWRRQRRFAHTVLTAAHTGHYYGYIDHEVRRFLYVLSCSPEKYYSLIDEYCGHITSRLSYGTPDSSEAHCQNAREFIPQISPAGPITNLMPFLGGLPEFLNPSIKAVRERREREAKLWKECLARVRRELDEGIAAPRSYARTYFERKDAETVTLKGTHDNKVRPFGFAPDDEEAAYAIGMLCTVGIFTIGGPLNTFFLASVLHPEWQQKARDEVDTVLGVRMIAEPHDVVNLPILRAFIKECLRWRPAVPLGVPRLVEEDNVYNGFFIPKGTVAHVVEQAISRNPQRYPDPEAFNPDRWLNPSYPTYNDLSLVGYHQFGTGYRVCPGIMLTESELLAACSGVLSGFTMRPKDGIPVDPWKMTSNVIGGPLEFDFDLKVREDKREFIEQGWLDAESKEAAEIYSRELMVMSSKITTS